MLLGLWSRFQNLIIAGLAGIAIGVGGSTVVSNTLDINVPFVKENIQGTAVQLRTAKVNLRDPVTGKKWQDLYIVTNADLITCRSNNGTLKTALEDQNVKLQVQSDKDAKALEEATKNAKDSKTALAAAERTRAQLSKQLHGFDFCARVKEVDDRFVETLK